MMRMVYKERGLTQVRLKQVLSYNRRTGIFVWRKQYHPLRIGREAGTKKARYVMIKVDQKVYAAHCLAWLYVTGRWPVEEIDHEDTDRHNNRWRNLREATRSQNARNRKTDQDKVHSKLKGVSWLKDRRKWSAYIRVPGRKHAKFIGHFDSEVEAHAAYWKRAKELYGDFARAA